MKKFKKNTIASMVELEMLHADVSVEAVGLFNATSAAFQRLSGFVGKAMGAIKSGLNGIKVYFGKDSKTQIHNIDLSAYLAFAQNYKYTDVKHIELQIPEGFKGNYTEYAKVLLKILEAFSANFITEVINPFNRYIGQLINNPTLLQSQVFKHDVKPEDIAKYKKELAKFHSGKKHNTLPFTDIFNRMTELSDLTNEINDILKITTDNGLGKIKEVVDEVNEGLENLLDVIGDGTVQPNAKVVQGLSDLIFELAQQVEFIAVLDSLVHSFLYTAAVNAERLKRAGTTISAESLALINSQNPYTDGWNTFKPTVEE